MEVPSGAARNAFVYFRYRVGNATRYNFRWHFSRRRNPLRAEKCLHVRVVDAVGRRLRRRVGGGGDALTIFVDLSASVGRRQLRHRKRRHRRLAERVGVSVVRGPVSPFLTMRRVTCSRNSSAHGRNRVNLWEMATARVLP